MIAPTYELDVLRTGSTGFRLKSSSGFSVFDIDAADGDTAIRFQKAGAYNWLVSANTENLGVASAPVLNPAKSTSASWTAENTFNVSSESLSCWE